MIKSHGFHCPEHLVCGSHFWPIQTSSPCQPPWSLAPGTGLGVAVPANCGFSLSTSWLIFSLAVLCMAANLVVQALISCIPHISSTLLCFRVLCIPEHSISALIVFCLPFFPPTYAPFLLLPRFPDALNLESVLTVPLLCPFLPLQNPQEGICSSPMAWSSAYRHP